MEEYQEKVDGVIRVLGSKLDKNMDEEMQKQNSLYKHMQDRLKMELMQNDNKVKDELLARINQMETNWQSQQHKQQNDSGMLKQELTEYLQNMNETQNALFR